MVVCKTCFLTLRKLVIVSAALAMAAVPAAAQIRNLQRATANPSGKISIAVLDLEGSNIDKSDLKAFTNRLGFELFNSGTFDIFERNRMKDVLSEQGFQNTGCVSTECAVEIGQLIGVSKVILGSIDRVESFYTVNIRMVDTRTGKIESFVTEDCSNCQITNVFASINKAVSRLCFPSSGNNQSRQQTYAEPPSRPVYPVNQPQRQQYQYQAQMKNPPAQVAGDARMAGSDGTSANAAGKNPNSHPKLTLGAKGGGGSCGLLSMGMSEKGWDFVTKLNWSLSLFSACNFNKSVACQGEVSLCALGGNFSKSFLDSATLDTYKAQLSYSIIYCTVAPLVKIGHRFDFITPSLILGPNIRFKMSSTEKFYVDSVLSSSVNFDSATSPMDVGLCIGIGNEIHLGKGNFIIDCTFDFGFLPILKSRYEEMTNMGIFISIGYSYDLF